MIFGIVTKGFGIGKKFGFPHTMNLKLKKMPRGLHRGVYIVKVSIKQQNSKARIFSGVLHYGPRPSLDAPKSFEIHCFGLKKNVIGKRVEVVIIKRLRAVQKFCSPEALKRAIAQDIKQAKKIVKNLLPDK